MQYRGKVYAKIGSKYIECSQTVEDLENEIKSLKNQNEKQRIEGVLLGLSLQKKHGTKI